MRQEEKERKENLPGQEKGQYGRVLTKPPDERKRLRKILQLGNEDFTFPAYLHFFLSLMPGCTAAQCTVNKPAEMSGLKFPGRAFFFTFTFF